MVGHVSGEKRKKTRAKDCLFLNEERVLRKTLREGKKTLVKIRVSPYLLLLDELDEIVRGLTEVETG